MSVVHFGEHITIDGYEGNPKKLDSKRIVKSALKDLVKELHMRALKQPIVVHAGDNHVKDPGGWSGFVMIAESHISIHTFPKRRFLSADVYTCKNGMDMEYVVDFFKKRFELQDVETNFVKRGLRYPEHNLV